MGQKRVDKEDFKTHAVFLADDIWALNASGATAYLQLALKAQHYQSLAILIPGEKDFLKVVSRPLEGVSKWLFQIGMIWTKELEQNITHSGMSIGKLHGVKYVQVVFPLLNILCLHLLLLLIIIIIDSLLRRRAILEQLVLERTKNLRDSERRFHDLVNLLPEMVFEIDTDGNITYANKEAQCRLGFKWEKTENHNLFSYIVEKEGTTVRERFQKALQDGNTDLKEFKAKGGDGTSFPLLLCAASITDGEHIVGARVIGIDITERHRLEEQLLKDRKMKAIGLMAGGVAHDLNNILSGIVSYPELLLLDQAKDSPLKGPLETIRKAGMDASEVVADLLTVARGVIAEREVVAPNDLIREYLVSPDFQELCTRHPLVSIEPVLDSELCNIACSAIYVRKCLMNLVTNAVEAISRHGILRIKTENRVVTAREQEQWQLPSQGQYTKITVSDTGVGIAQAEIQHIFEPFYTKKVMGRSGTGLGLAVVWNIVRDHGGTVNVRSSSAGTTFDMYFPSVAEPRVSAATERDWRELKGKGEAILVVDDEPRQRDVATKLLQSLEYETFVVSSGEEALKYLTINSVDVLLLDMLMAPGQYNGRQTYEEVLKMHPGQKAIIASGYAEDEDVRVTLEMGAGGFIAKPYTLEQLGTTLQTVLCA
ncbi:hybrid sensor histidine kinase/response regulator [Desulfogranum marinum]|uniref:hybrid sensor histidine kinase/response regulator n=1 Tax=Desulfogranum marinum TaxID=453220 RepID=UPI0019635821|nr:response regulator [Desulfogranum marinum]